MQDLGSECSVEKALPYFHLLTKGTRNIDNSSPMRVSMIEDRKFSNAHPSKTSKNGIVRIAKLEHTQPHRVAGSFV